MPQSTEEESIPNFYCDGMTLQGSILTCRVNTPAYFEVKAVINEEDSERAEIVKMEGPTVDKKWWLQKLVKSYAVGRQYWINEKDQILSEVQEEIDY